MKPRDTTSFETVNNAIWNFSYKTHAAFLLPDSLISVPYTDMATIVIKRTLPASTTNIGSSMNALSPPTATAHLRFSNSNHVTGFYFLYCKSLYNHHDPTVQASASQRMTFWKSISFKEVDGINLRSTTLR
jgi:hypothetical protein